MDTLRLDKLPTEILNAIFNECDLRDFPRLDRVCKRFHQILRDNEFWTYHQKKLLVTNQVSEQFRKRCNLLLPSYCKYIISNNWVLGNYKKSTLQKQQHKLIPWLQLTSDKLWWSGKNMLFGFDRQEQTHQKNTIHIKEHYIHRTFPPGRAFSQNTDHIGKFVIWRDYIVNGNSNGSIMWQTESPFKNRYGCTECKIKKQLKVHDKSISALDSTSNIIFSAASSECAVIRVENSLDIDSINDDNIVRKTIYECKIELLAINPSGTIVSGYVGEELNRILYMDLEHGLEFLDIYTPQFGGTRDMLWENPNTLLLCGYYDIQKWDLRVNNCVSTWHYPVSMETHCISSDHHNTMITGTHQAEAVLWDQRMPNFVQMYCMIPFAKYNSLNSPIYSLRFDSTKLYCATDRFLYELDFSERKIVT